MSFYRKILLSIFLTSVVVVVTLTFTLLFSVQRDAKDQFLERYVKLADVIGNAVVSAEAAVEKVSVNAARHLDEVVRDRGLPSGVELAALARNLGITQFAVTDRNGRFVRDTVTDPKVQTKTLFDFCDGYRKLLTGESPVEATPILPSFPYKGPFKSVMIPSHDRRYILEPGMHLDDIGKILAKTIRTDENIRSISLLSPNGFNFGTIYADGRFEDGDQQIGEVPRAGVLSFDHHSLVVAQKVAVASAQCCECKVKNVTAASGYHYILRIEADTGPLYRVLDQAKWGALALSLALLLLSGFLSHLLAARLVRRIRVVDDAVREMNVSGELSAPLSLSGRDEISSLAHHFNQMVDSLLEFRRRHGEMERATALGEQAAQLAHDIRSPLVALNSVLGTLPALPAEKQSIIRGASQRINDIANGLLRSSGPTATNRAESLLVLALRLVGEKRVQYSGRIEISVDFAKGYDLFARVDGRELARVLSNLVDNSAEALGGSGSIQLRLYSSRGHGYLEVVDNGPGIPPEILAKLGEKGQSHGKAGGHGLGLYHAHKTLREQGGELTVESVPGCTTVRLRMPLAEVPLDFPLAVTLQPGALVVCVDDDPTVHALWAGRIQRLPGNISYRAFSKTTDFFAWARSHPDPRAVYLVDQEFSSEIVTGLELIASLGLAEQSLLVTSHGTHARLREAAEKLGVKVLPKELAPFLPLPVKSELSEFRRDPTNSPPV